jgi:putative ABC transport system substrate-binding protein
LTDRRTVIRTLTSAALAIPHLAVAQARGKVYRIGVLSVRPTADLVGPQPRSQAIGALLLGLRELGYVYGQHYVIEARGSSGQPDRFPALVAELLGRRVDVVVATSTALPALKQAASPIPVVMAAPPDPVGQGYVASLARPGGSFTGLSLQAAETSGKRLELLKELVPHAAPVAVLWNQLSVLYLEAAEAAARVRGWSLLPLEVPDIAALEAAFNAAAAARSGGLLVFAAGVVFPHARRVADLAARHRLPAMYEFRTYVEAGGLISYGPDINDIWRRAALFVDKILKGATPADLPIEQPSKFELLINLRVANTLGLAIPQAVLLRADEVVR